MGDYSDGKQPQPGRHTERIIEKHIEVEKSPAQNDEPAKLDQDAINAIANAVIGAIGSKSNVSVNSKETLPADSYDDSATLARLADAMVVQRGDGQSNFDDLGSIKKTKKKDGDVDQTIDILSGLDD